MTIRPFAARDADQVLATLRLVFRQRHGFAMVEHDLSLWRWQHLQNPAGSRLHLAIADGGEVVSIYAAIPQRADLPHGRGYLAQSLHTLTHPDHRGWPHHDELIATLGHAATTSPQPATAFGYGMPLAGAEQRCRKLLGYRQLHGIEYWLRPSGSPLPRAAAHVQLQHVEHLPRDVDALWQQSLPSVPCSVRKDHSYLTWRYVAHPERSDYTRVLAYRDGQLSGLMVLRSRHDLMPAAVAITELICRDEDDATAMTLLREAARIARREHRHLLAVFADHDPNAARMAVANACRVPSANWSERRINFRILGHGVTPTLLADRWRYSLGDTDLV